MELVLIEHGFAVAALAFENAFARNGATLETFMVTYRAVALAHPHLYRLINGGPLPVEARTPGIQGRTAALLSRVLPQPELALAAFAFAHGMTILELDDRFPPGADLDAAWRAGTQACRRRPCDAGTRKASTPPAESPGMRPIAAGRDGGSALLIWRSRSCATRYPGCFSSARSGRISFPTRVTSRLASSLRIRAPGRRSHNLPAPSATRGMPRSCLTGWGWVGNAYRSYAARSGAGSTMPARIEISLHRFTSSTGAAYALSYFAHDRAVALEQQEQLGNLLLPCAAMVTGDGMATRFLRSGNLVVRVTVVMPGSMDADASALALTTATDIALAVLAKASDSGADRIVAC